MAVGIFNTAGFAADEAKKSFAAQFARISPNGGAPLIALTSMLATETALAIEHGFYTKTMIFPALTSTAADASGATTLNVASTANIVSGMMFRNETSGEQVVVTAVPSATTVTVKRGIGTVAAAATVNGDVWYMSGTAYEEASLRPQAVQIVPTRLTNYTQIFRNSWSVSKTAGATGTIVGGGAVAEAKMDVAAFHAQDMEKAVIWGQKFMGTLPGSTSPFHTMDGMENMLRQVAPTQIVTLGGSATPTTWTALEAALDIALDTVTDVRGGNGRAVFCGGQALRAFHQVFQKNSAYTLEGQVNEFGLRFGQFITPRGDFKLVQHSLFNAFGRTSAWAKSALVLDMANFNLAYLRKTEHADYNANGTQVDNGIDAVGGTLTTEVTCLHKNIPSNMILKNFTTGAAG